jgi:heme-degrading monooxygenase HmoA
VSGFAKTPEPPYVAVIFTSRLAGGAGEDYAAAGARMEALVASQPGYLGKESARGEDGLGITVSYWRDEASARAWKAVAEHQEVQRLGYARFYEAFITRVAVVHRDHSFDRKEHP